MYIYVYGISLRVLYDNYWFLLYGFGGGELYFDLMWRWNFGFRIRDSIFFCCYGEYLFYKLSF